MEIVYLLLPLAGVLVVAICAALLWAVRSGQFDDLEGPAHRILMDDEPAPRRAGDDRGEKPGDDRGDAPG